jgi:tight adherence protein B
MALVIAALVFLAVLTLVGGLWWAFEARRRIAARLLQPGPAEAEAEILRGPAAPDAGSLGRAAAYQRLVALAEQAGYGGGHRRFLAIVGAFVVSGFLLGWLRTGGPGWGAVLGLLLGAVPVGYLVYRRHQRLRRFEELFPDALDMMGRSIRAGNAMISSIQLVGDEMPDPVGQEFRRVTEEIRFGLDAGEALYGLQRRIPTEDVTFFCAAIRIQRGAGGNLSEILERLSDVIRKRGELLSHARVLSAQHRWAAIWVGLSPLAFAVIFQIVTPGYFDPLLQSPIGPMLIVAGLCLEAIGFFMVWRISSIKV